MEPDIFYFFRSELLSSFPPQYHQTLTLLGKAVRERRQVVLTYAPNLDQKRHLLPEVLFRHRDTWYVVAWDYGCLAARTFNISHIGQIELTNQADCTHGVAADFIINGLPWLRETEETPPVSTRFLAHIDIPTPAMEWGNKLIFDSACGDLAAMKFDLASGADRNFLGPDGRRPLHGAVDSGIWLAVQLLLGAGANPQLPDFSGTPVLHYLVAQLNLAWIREVVETYHVELDSVNSQHETPLYCAVKVDSTELVKFFLAHGASVNLPDQMGRTAIFAAVNNRNWELLAALVEAGANINWRDHAGRTPAMLARGKCFKYLVEHGAELDARDKQGNSVLLHHANDLTELKCLVARGGDIYERNAQGENVLLIAQPRYRVVRYFIEHYDFSPDECNNAGTTILHRAVLYGDLRTVRYLIGQGADWRAVDQNGFTPRQALFEKYRIDEESCSFAGDDKDSHRREEIFTYLSELENSPIR